MEYQMWDTTDKYTRIKLCKFESLDSAYEASFMGADALGFHIFKHHDYQKRVRKFRDIFQYLPKSINKTLLTDISIDDLLNVLSDLQGDIIQLYPDWTKEEITRLRENVTSPIRILKVMSDKSEENFTSNANDFLKYYEDTVDGFLLDSSRNGGSGRIADWTCCADIVKNTHLPIFLAGGLNADNVNEAIKKVRPFGVDVETGVSDRILNGPLVKNMMKCHQFIAAVKEEDRQLSTMKQKNAY